MRKRSACACSVEANSGGFVIRMAEQSHSLAPFLLALKELQKESFHSFDASFSVLPWDSMREWWWAKDACVPSALPSAPQCKSKEAERHAVEDVSTPLNLSHFKWNMFPIWCCHFLVGCFPRFPRCLHTVHCHYRISQAKRASRKPFYAKLAARRTNGALLRSIVHRANGVVGPEGSAFKRFPTMEEMCNEAIIICRSVQVLLMEGFFQPDWSKSLWRGWLFTRNAHLFGLEKVKTNKYSIPTKL